MFDESTYPTLLLAILIYALKFHSPSATIRSSAKFISQSLKGLPKIKKHVLTASGIFKLQQAKLFIFQYRI